MWVDIAHAVDACRVKGTFLTTDGIFVEKLSVVLGTSGISVLGAEIPIEMKEANAK